MKLFQFFIIGLILISGCSDVDENSPAQSDVFLKYYGGRSANTAVDLVTYNYLDKDETKIGYIVLASKDSSNQQYFYLIKTDDEGNEIDYHVVDIGEAGSSDTPKRIKKIADNRYMVVGYTTNTASVDKGVWFEIGDDLVVENLTISKDTLRTVDVIKVDDDLVLLGEKMLKEENQELGDQIILMKYNTLNDTVYWMESHGVRNEDETALALFENPNGNLLFVGTSDAYAASEGSNLYMVETNSLGTTNSTEGVSKPLFSGENLNEFPTSVIRTLSGYAITGYSTNSDLTSTARGFVVNITTGAEILNTHVFEFRNNDLNTNVPVLPYGITQDYSGNYFVVGELPSYTSNEGPKQSEMGLLRLNPMNGFTDVDYPYCQAYGRFTGNDFANSILMHPVDGDLVIAGTVDFGSNITLICLMKLSKTGGLVNRI